MPFQKVEYEFPDEQEESTEIEIESSSAEEIQSKPSSVKDNIAPVEDTVADDVEIEVVDDTPEVDRNRKPARPPEDVTDEELDEYSEKVQKRIKSLSRGYHDERRAKEAALRERQELERYAKQIMEENEQLKGTVSKNQEALLEQAKRTANGELILAKRAYKQAYEAGDGDALVEAQEKLTAAKLKSDRLANVRSNALQQNETAVKPATVTETQVENDAPAPVDERASEWAKSNTWFGTDDEMTSFALGLHTKLVKAGVDPQSDEYYESINTRMRQVFPDSFEDTDNSPEEEPQPRKQATVVAPATRSTAPKKVTLSKTQVSLAKRLGVPLDIYAKQVAEEMRKANG